MAKKNGHQRNERQRKTVGAKEKVASFRLNVGISLMNMRIKISISLTLTNYRHVCNKQKVMKRSQEHKL